MKRTMVASAGIYRYTDPKTNKVYIGQSNDIDRRLRDHQYALVAGTHCNYKLQAAYDLCPGFFDVLERVSTQKEPKDQTGTLAQKELNEHKHVSIKKELNERERYWIRIFQANDDNHGFNLNAGGSYIGPQTRKEICRKHYDEFVKARSEYIEAQIDPESPLGKVTVAIAPAETSASPAPPEPVSIHPCPICIAEKKKGVTPEKLEAAKMQEWQKYSC